MATKIVLTTPISESYPEVELEERIEFNTETGTLSGFIAQTRSINGVPTRVTSKPFAVTLPEPARKALIEQILGLAQVDNPALVGTITFE